MMTPLLDEKKNGDPLLDNEKNDEPPSSENTLYRRLNLNGDNNLKHSKW